MKALRDAVTEVEVASQRRRPVAVVSSSFSGGEDRESRQADYADDHCDIDFTVAREIEQCPKTNWS